MRLFFAAVLAIIVVSAAAPGYSFAQNEKFFFKGIEVLSGYGHADLKSKEEYNFSPVLLDIDFQLSKFLQFQIEPAFAAVYQPDTNVEVGNSFLLKAGLLSETRNLRPYIRGGVGIIYMSQHLSEQSTQFNFTEHIGAGSHYFFNRDSSLICEARFRHTSNGGMRKPNNGIDSYIVLLGLSHKF